MYEGRPSRGAEPEDFRSGYEVSWRRGIGPGMPRPNGPYRVEVLLSSIDEGGGEKQPF